MDKFGVIVVAAGKGSRMQSAESKQYLLLDHKPILVHTLELFEQMIGITNVVLVVGKGDEMRCKLYMEHYGLTKVTAIVCGGADRQASVYKGLKCLTNEIEWVLVHDAVRPFVTPEHVLDCLHKAMECGAAVLAVPVKDTIKVVNTAGAIQSTPDRQSLWAIQTPQAFRLSNLLHAHEQAMLDSFTGTDDAMLIERIGEQVCVVEGSYSNVKITTPEDILWAEWMIQQRKGEHNS